MENKIKNNNDIENENEEEEELKFEAQIAQKLIEMQDESDALRNLLKKLKEVENSINSSH